MVNASKRDMATGVAVEHNNGSAGRFAAHPTSMQARPLNKFMKMIQETGWTASIMLGTVKRQHPLIDVDLHTQLAKTAGRHVTVERLREAADKTQRRMFQCGSQVAKPVVLQPPNHSGYHVVAVGCVITRKHKRMNRMFKREK